MLQTRTFYGFAGPSTLAHLILHARYALSGFIPFWRFLIKVILPSNQKILKFRQKVFVAMVPLVGALQPLLVGTVLFGLCLNRPELW